MTWKLWMCAVLALCLLAPCLLAGCGDEAGGHSDADGKPGGGAATGELVKVAYDFGVGDGVRMAMTTTVTLELSGGAESPEPMEMTMVVRTMCSEVRENGERVLEYVFESMSLPGGAPAPADLEGLKGKATIGVDGRMKAMSFEGGDPALTEALTKAMAGGGLPSTLPFPPEGLRVGDAIDMKDIYPPGMFDELLSVVPGAKTTSTMDGKLVLMGTKMIDGAEAAEFAVSMTMSMSMVMGAAGSTMHTETTSTSSGRQFVDLKTGFPVGESTLRGTSDTTMSGGSFPDEKKMKSTTTVTCICKRLK